LGIIKFVMLFIVSVIKLDFDLFLFRRIRPRSARLGHWECFADGFRRIGFSGGFGAGKVVFSGSC